MSVEERAFPKKPIPAANRPSTAIRVDGSLRLGKSAGSPARSTFLPVRSRRAIPSARPRDVAFGAPREADRTVFFGVEARAARSSESANAAKPRGPDPVHSRVFPAAARNDFFSPTFTGAMTGPELHVLNFIGDFGETVILVPPLAAVCLYLFAAGAARLAVAWPVTFLVVAVVVATLKSEAWPASGHAAMGWAFYGGLAVLLWRTAPYPSWRLRGASLALVSLMGLLSWSIWMLGWHGPVDIVSGLLVGSLSPLTLAFTPQSDLLPRRTPLAVLLIAILVIAPLHGIRLNYVHAGKKVIAALARI